MKPLRHPLRWLSPLRWALGRCARRRVSLAAGHRRPLFVLACLLLACAPAAQALKPDKAFANYVLNTWSIQDGLPQISALSLAQDRTGYIWVGTQSGLARFDGVRFTSYTPEDTPALAGIWIRSLLADADGRLWIGTYQGLAVLQDGQFRSVQATDPGRYPSLDIFALAHGAGGTLLARRQSRRLADRIAVIHAGRLTEAHPAAAWTRAQIGLAMTGSTDAAVAPHAA